MTKAELEKLILDTVEARQGVKGVDLVVEIARASGASDLLQATTTVERLVQERRLVEVEYVLPSMPHRAKTFLLPADTTITIRT